MLDPEPGLSDRWAGRRLPRVREFLTGLEDHLHDVAEGFLAQA